MQSRDDGVQREATPHGSLRTKRATPGVAESIARPDASRAHQFFPPTCIVAIGSWRQDPSVRATGTVFEARPRPSNSRPGRKRMEACLT